MNKEKSLLKEVTERIYEFGSLDSVRDEELIERIEQNISEDENSELDLHMIELAEQQLTGYATNDIIDLVETMGLTKFEWMYLKENESLSYLSKIDKQEIDKHFGMEEPPTIDHK